MPKPSNRDKLLTEGLRVVHERGYAGASVRDIVAAAGVPQGSFTNHFASKEVFGLEVVNLYHVASCALLDVTLYNESLAPLQRLAAYLDANANRLDESGIRNGCLFGNFIVEASEHSEVIRARVVEILSELESSVAACLHAAVTACELPSGFACEETAAFLVSGLQGATLMARAQRNREPLERFKRTLFTRILI